MVVRDSLERAEGVLGDAAVIAEVEAWSDSAQYEGVPVGAARDADVLGGL